MSLASSHMLAAKRRELVLEAVKSNHAERVSDLAQRFAVSEMTIRRDLQTLAEEGKLVRVRGGAVVGDANRPFAEVEAEHFDAKSRIGAVAAQLVEDGETILIDIGTTPLQLARHLAGRQATVMTNNLAVFEKLVDEPAIDLILLGGQLHREYRALSGFLVEEALAQLSADRAFISAVGLRRDLSVVDDAVGEMRIKRAMIAAAGNVVLLLDSSKFGSEGGARICEANRIDVLVTDKDAPEDMVRQLERRGVRVLLA
jgi:DeoR/GlpR family transcriptional regulator of sugar metabolism